MRRNGPRSRRSNNHVTHKLTLTTVVLSDKDAAPRVWSIDIEVQPVTRCKIACVTPLCQRGVIVNGGSTTPDKVSHNIEGPRVGTFNLDAVTIRTCR